MKRIRVPAEMLNCAMKASMDAGLPIGPSTELSIVVEAVLRYISEHPQIPTDEQVAQIWNEMQPSSSHGCYQQFTEEWQRRCFQEEEPEIWSQERVEKELDKASGIWDKAFAQVMKKLVMDYYLKPEKLKFVGPEGIDFEEKEPELPAEIQDLLCPDFINAIEAVTGQGPTRTENCFKSAVIEAFRRGLRKGEKK